MNWFRKTTALDRILNYNSSHALAAIEILKVSENKVENLKSTREKNSYYRDSDKKIPIKFREKH